MFKHILLPVDGALTMTSLVHPCLVFAAAAGARVEAVHVLPPPGGGSEDGAARAARILQQVERDAAELGVPCSGRVVTAAQPWLAILAAAQATGADLICMAAHGRLNTPAQALGSQTAQVLAHAGVAVLVFP